MKRAVILLSFIAMATACTEFRAGLAFEEMKREVRESNIVLDGDFLSDDDSFRQTRLYRFLEYLPKGSDLHIHNGVMLPLDEYLNFLERMPEIAICCSPDSLGYARPASQVQNLENYKPLSDAYRAGVTYQDLKRSLTLKGRPDSIRIWDHFGKMFGMVGDYLKCDELQEEYLYTAFSYYAKHGVYHLENRQTFGGSPEKAAEKIRLIKRAQDRTREEYPEFSIRLILTGLKNPGFEKLNEDIYKFGLKANGLVKDSLWNCEQFIVGLDFAQEEDKSYPLMTYKEMLETAKESDHTLQISLHAGESLNPENREIESAIKLGAKRLGHSYNLYMHPELIKEIKRRDICLETCPVSNCTLGYCSDLHNHPMRDYIKAGIKVAICDDDPLFQEGESLVDDFFVAAVYWDLPLREIKKLCKNSIEYSFLSKESKTALLQHWRAEWKSYLRKHSVSVQ